MASLNLNLDKTRKVDHIIDVLGIEKIFGNTLPRLQQLEPLSDIKKLEEFINLMKTDPGGREILEMVPKLTMITESCIISTLFVFAERDLTGKIPRYTIPEVAKILKISMGKVRIACKKITNLGMLQAIREKVGHASTAYIPTHKGYSILRFIEKHRDLLK